MAQKRIDITSADTKQIGFEYQYLYFIARLLQLSPGDEVGYEALDDVHVISSTTGETAYIQTKHAADFNFYTYSLGEAAANRIAASRKLADILQKGDASDFYLSLRIEV